MFGPRATMSGDIWAYSEFINFPGGRPLWRERERERREEGPRRAITATLRSDKEFERRREKKKERSH